MTPGFAKPRSELPWLPYGACDRVTINAHNFPSSAWTPSVNGKSPVYAWVPSRDSAGNGTTTLTDLAGSRAGTLTNMDAATDWVSDTGAGGVRALDFDATNDFVNLSSGAVLPGSGGLAISWWEKVSASATTGNRSRFRFNTGTRGFLLFRSSSTGYTTVAWGRDNMVPQLRANVTSMASAVGIWVHYVLVGTAGANSTTAADWTLYENDVAATTLTGPGLSSFTADVNRIGHDGILSASGCLIDDVRIWNQSLDAADVADLYASGAGRGVQA